MQTIKIITPKVDIRSDVKKNHIALEGPSRTTQFIAVSSSYGGATGTVNPAQASWDIQPPSHDTVVDRHIRVKFYVKVNAPGGFSNNNGTSNPPVLECPRQFPIASVTDSIQLSLNGENVSDNVSEKLHAMLCYGNTANERRRAWSEAPSMPDAYQEYTDGALYGSAKDPIQPTGAVEIDSGRSIVPDPSQPNDGNNLYYVVTEPLFISPLEQGIGKEHEGFVHIDSLNLTMRFRPNWSRFMSTKASSVAGALGVSFYKAPEMHLNFLSVDRDMQLPMIQTLPYYKHLSYVQGGQQALPAGGSTTVVLDSIRLSSIPKTLFLFAAHDRATRDEKTSDAFLAIDRVDVTFENRSGLLGTATPEDLYQISVSNGCNLSWEQFTRHKGSVVALQFGKDLGLDDGLAPGVRGNYSIQVTLTLRNPGVNPFTFEAWQSYQMVGTMEVAKGSARATIGNLMPNEVLTAQSHEMTYYDIYPDAMYGGSFWSSLKHIVSGIGKGVKTVAKGITKALPVAETVLGAVAPEFAPALATVGQAAKLAGGRMRTGGALHVGGGLKMRARRR